MNKQAADKSLYAGLQRVASQHPDTRKHLVPLLAKYACLACGDEDLGDEMLAADDDLFADDESSDGVEAGRCWGTKSECAKKKVDDNVPYRKWPKSPPAGTDGSPARREYNNWYRDKVCPKNHKTVCGDPSLKSND